MNPGSSQFASQFPDVEETMSKMESKKLPIFDALVFPGRLVDCVRASDHGRIAHEQREVIRKLDAQVAALANWVNAHDCNPAVNHLLMRAREARAAAAPYLLED